jgi:tetratricopeptide (TPR) repeat protein
VVGDAGLGRPVIGREREIDVVSSFLDSFPDRPAALLVEGAAGIGKSTVWFEAVHLAADRGFRVLKARPAESEARLSYAALADLIGPAFEEARSQLPDPQELALAATLLRVTSTQAVDPRTAATAVVGVLTEVSGVCPVLVAIDDVQWVDLASQRALEFAARRLPASVGFLVTRRSNGPAAAPLDLDRALPPDALQRMVLESLSLASLHHIVRERLGGTPTRPVIARVAEASGGNPFFAIEIARALASRRGGSDERGPLPVPQSVQRLASERISALSATAREAVLVAASLSRPTIGAIAAALPSDSGGTAAVLEAEDAGILVSERGRVRFAHPLLASAVYGSVSETQRRVLHRRLAEVVNDAEERARHLSQSVAEPDESAAAEIEDAGGQAVLRGAFDAAAELFGAARRLTRAGSDDALVRRTLAQASALLRTGDVADARRLAEQSKTDRLSAALRAERLQLLAEVEWDDGSIGLAMSHLEQALEVARDDPARGARISARLVLIGVPGDPVRAQRRAERAVRQVDAERDPLVLSSLLIDLCLLDLMLGRTPRTNLMRRGLALELSAGPEAYPHPVPLIWFQCVDDLEGARERHVRESEWARDHSDEAHASERLSYLALAEFHAGHCDLAERLIEQSSHGWRPSTARSHVRGSRSDCHAHGRS